MMGSESHLLACDTIHDSRLITVRCEIERARNNDDADNDNTSNSKDGRHNVTTEDHCDQNCMKDPSSNDEESRSSVENVHGPEL